MPHDEAYRRLHKDAKTTFLHSETEAQTKFGKAAVAYEILKSKGFYDKSKDKLYECMINLASKDFEGLDIQVIFRYLWDESKQHDFDFHRCVGPITDRYIEKKRINDFLFIKYHYPHVKKGYQFMVQKKELVLAKYEEIKQKVDHHAEINHLNSVGYLEFFCKNYETALGCFVTMLEKMKLEKDVPKGRLQNGMMMVERCQKKIERQAALRQQAATTVAQAQDKSNPTPAL